MRRATRCRESTIRPSQAFSNPQLCKERSSGSVSFWFCPEIFIIKIIINNDFELLMRVNLCCEHLELKLWVDWGAGPLVEGDLLIIITMVVIEMVTIVLGVDDPPWSALRMLKDPKSSVMMI